MSYNFRFEEGEIVGYKELVDKYLVWKELRDLRKQLLNLEGFEYLVLNLEEKGGEYNLKYSELKGHFTQIIKVIGKIKKRGKLDLLIDATFANLPSFIFKIKGSYKTPYILPAPAKMAGSFVKKSSKFALDLLGSFRDLTR